MKPVITLNAPFEGEKIIKSGDVRLIPSSNLCVGVDSESVKLFFECRSDSADDLEIIDLVRSFVINFTKIVLPCCLLFRSRSFLGRSFFCWNFLFNSSGGFSGEE